MAVGVLTVCFTSPKITGMFFVSLMYEPFFTSQIRLPERAVAKNSTEHL